MLLELGSLIIVGIIWGVTNPSLKKGSVGMESKKSNSNIRQFFSEMKFIYTKAKFLIPFFVNQLGSALYLFTLRNADLSLAVPVANTLSFVFTSLFGWLFGEQTAGKKTYMGMVLVLVGTAICSYDKCK